MPEPPSEKIDAGMLCKLLAKRYEPPQWCVEYEITIANRRLDVVALNLWGGRNLIGFEIKATRGDWRRELQLFDKSSDTSQVVDEFYVVAPKGIVAKDELPKGWGLLEARGSRLYLGAHPERRPHNGMMSREAAIRIIAHLMRERERKTSHELAAERVALRAEIEPQLSATLDRLQARYNELYQDHQKLTRALGVADDWQANKRALAIATVLTDANHDPDLALATLTRTILSLDHLLTRLRVARTEYDKSVE